MQYHLLTYFLAGFLGVVLQMLIKIPALQVRSKAANHKFSFKEYLADDWAVLLASIVSVCIMIMGIDELLAIKPALAEYIKWFFVFVGFTGSTIITGVFSVFSKKLTSIIDIKSNIADGVTPPVNASNIDGVKEMAKDDAVVLPYSAPNDKTV